MSGSKEKDGHNIAVVSLAGHHIAVVSLAGHHSPVVSPAGHHNAVAGINQATKCSYSMADACIRTISLHAAWQMVLYPGTLENICYRAFDWN
jgi:hypothetical protein